MKKISKNSNTNCVNQWYQQKFPGSEQSRVKELKQEFMNKMAFKFCCILTFCNVMYYVAMLLEKDEDSDKSFDQTNWFLIFTISSLAIFVLLFTIKYVKSLAIFMMPLNVLQTTAILNLYSFEESQDPSQSKSMVALLSIILLTLFQTGLQTHFLLSITIFIFQTIVSQTYIWLHYEDSTDTKYGISQNFLIALSITLFLREVILSFVAYFYEKTIYAFFKDQVHLEKKYKDLKSLLQQTGKKIAIFDQNSGELVFQVNLKTIVGGQQQNQQNNVDHATKNTGAVAATVTNSKLDGFQQQRQPQQSTSGPHSKLQSSPPPGTNQQPNHDIVNNNVGEESVQRSSPLTPQQSHNKQSFSQQHLHNHHLNNSQNANKMQLMQQQAQNQINASAQNQQQIHAGVQQRGVKHSALLLPLPRLQVDNLNGSNGGIIDPQAHQAQASQGQQTQSRQQQNQRRPSLSTNNLPNFQAGGSPAQNIRSFQFRNSIDQKAVQASGLFQQLQQQNQSQQQIGNNVVQVNNDGLEDQDGGEGSKQKKNMSKSLSAQLDSELDSNLTQQKLFRAFSSLAEVHAWQQEEQKRVQQQGGFSQSNVSMTSTFQPRQLLNERSTVIEQLVSLHDIIEKFKKMVKPNDCQSDQQSPVPQVAVQALDKSYQGLLVQNRDDAADDKNIGNENADAVKERKQEYQNNNQNGNEIVGEGTTRPNMQLFLALVRDNDQLDVFKATCLKINYDESECFAIYLKEYNAKFLNFYYTSNSTHFTGRNQQNINRSIVGNPNQIADMSAGGNVVNGVWQNFAGQSRPSDDISNFDQVSETQYSNITVLHEIRDPLIQVTHCALNLAFEIYTRNNRELRDRLITMIYYKSQHIQSSLGDVLDYDLIQKGLYQQCMRDFDPNEVIQLVSDIFKEQVESKQMNLQTRSLGCVSTGLNSDEQFIRSNSSRRLNNDIVSHQSQQHMIYSGLLSKHSNQMQQFLPYNLHGGSNNLSKMMQLPLLHGDQKRFQQVLMNLVKNALRYTPRSGTIKIESCYLMHLRQVQIQVSDNGLGVELSEIGKMINARPSLQLSQQLVQRNGGKLQIESEGRNKGSTLTFTMNMGIVKNSTEVLQDQKKLEVIHQIRSKLKLKSQKLVDKQRRCETGSNITSSAQGSIQKSMKHNQQQRRTMNVSDHKLLYQAQQQMEELVSSERLSDSASEATNLANQHRIVATNLANQHQVIDHHQQQKQQSNQLLDIIPIVAKEESKRSQSQGAQDFVNPTNADGVNALDHMISFERKEHDLYSPTQRFQTQTYKQNIAKLEQNVNLFDREKQMQLWPNKTDQDQYHQQNQNQLLSTANQDFDGIAEQQLKSQSEFQDQQIMMQSVAQIPNFDLCKISIESVVPEEDESKEETKRQQQPSSINQQQNAAISISPTLINTMGQNYISKINNQNAVRSSLLSLEQQSISAGQSDFDQSSIEGIPQVLIVDDQVVQIAAMSMFLKKKNIKSDCALGGEAAIKMVKKRMRLLNDISSKSFSSNPLLDHQQQFPYKLIFMDYSMPQMDGIETSKKILELINLSQQQQNSQSFSKLLLKQSSSQPQQDCTDGTPKNNGGVKQSPSPCICILSAYSDSPYIEQAKKIGIKHYLFKPVANEDLTNLLEEFGLL